MRSDMVSLQPSPIDAPCGLTGAVVGLLRTREPRPADRRNVEVNQAPPKGSDEQLPLRPVATRRRTAPLALIKLGVRWTSASINKDRAAGRRAGTLNNGGHD